MSNRNAKMTLDSVNLSELEDLQKDFIMCCCKMDCLHHDESIKFSLHVQDESIRETKVF